MPRAQDSYTLLRGFTLLEDRSGVLTLDDVLQPAQQARFGPVAQSGSVTNFGLTSLAFWPRIELRPETGAPAPWLPEVAYPPLTLQSGQGNTLYLRVQSQGTLPAPVRLWQAQALWAHDQAEYAMLTGSTSSRPRRSRR